MKTYLKRFSFVAVLIVLVLTLASCSPSPKLDLKKAAENLREKDYYVIYFGDYYFDEYDIDEMYLKEELRATDGGDYLHIYKFRDLRSAKLFYKTCKVEYNNEIETLKLEIKMNRNMLNRYPFKLTSLDKEDLQEEIKLLKEELKEFKKENVIGRSGKYVWVGTADAIKDSKY